MRPSRPRGLRSTGRPPATWGLAAIIVVAALLRVVGLDWDDGTLLHPDERYLSMTTSALGRAPGPTNDAREAGRRTACLARHPATGGVGPWLDTACSAWAPPNVGYPGYPYGVWPIAAVRIAASSLESAGWLPRDDLPRLAIAGRAVATLADLIAVACAFLLGRALGGRRAGLVAAALYALAPLPLQLARFYTVDPFATALFALALVVAVRHVERGERADACAFGVAAGLAAAAKLSMAPLVALVVPMVALAPHRGAAPASGAQALAARLVTALGTALMALVVFRIAQPTFFAGPGLTDVGWAPGALDLLRDLRGAADGTRDMPPAWQWIGRVRWLEPLRNVLVHGAGPVLALAGVGALAVAAWRAIGRPRRHRGAALLALVLIAYAAWLGAPFVSSMRYWLPLLPLLAAFAGWGLVVAARRMRRRWRIASALPAAAVAVASLVAAAWLAIPLAAPTRLWATHWILQHVPSGASAPIDLSDRLPARINWPLAGTLPTRPDRLRARTEVPSSAAIDRLQFRVDDDSRDPLPGRIELAIATDAGRVLLPRAVLEARAVTGAAGFSPGDRVVEVRFEDPIPLDAGDQVDIEVSVVDGALAVSGAAIAIEGPWDDPVPLRARRLPPGTDARPGIPERVRARSTAQGVDPLGQRYYREVDLAMAYADDEAKRARLASALDRAGWLTISSQRFYDAVGRDPYRFPLSVAWYDALFAGRLGYDLVAQFRSPPRLGPLVFEDLVLPWPDGYAATRAAAAHGPEEARSVYDHPPVFVFRKRDAYDGVVARAEFAHPVLATFDEARRAGPPSAAGRVVRSPATADAAPDLLMMPPERIRARDALPPAGVRTTGALASVALWYAAVAALGAAMLPILARWMPGAPSLAHALARVAGLFAWAALAWWTAWLGAGTWTPAGLLVAAGAVVATGVAAGRVGRPTAGPAIRRSGFVAAEGVFALAFLAGLALRVLNPDLWAPGYGGEKPMDFALLNAVLAADAFPPADPWFAGGRVNYYYFGYVPVAALAKITGTPPEIAYNLAVALWFALTAQAVWGVARTIALACGGEVARRAALAGGVATVAAVGMGNLGVLAALIDAPPRGGGWLERLASAFTNPDPRWYWSPTRLVAERTAGGHEIVEFPFFTFLHGDLHAHLLAMPLAIAVWGLATALVLRTRPRVAPGGMVAIALALAAATALLRATSTWEWPAATVVGVSAAICAAVRATAAPAARARAIAVAIVAFLAVQVLVAWPFTSAFVTGEVGLRPWHGAGTPFVTWLANAGLFVAVLLPWLARLAGLRLAGPPATDPYGRPRPLASRIALAASAIAFAALVAELAWTAWRGGDAGARGALAAFAALAAAVALDARVGAARRWIATIVATAASMQLLPELATVGADIGRQNTVFKLTLASWLALSLATGPALVDLWAAGTGRAWRAGFAAIAALALAYVPIGVASRSAARFEGERPATLDGLAYLSTAALHEDGVRYALAEDAAIIAWLRAHAPLGSVVLEAHRPEYRHGSRIASATGLATPLGYRWHQTQQRPAPPLGELVNLRVDNVDAIWRGDDLDRAWRAIGAYRIRYAVVGPVERATYPAAALARFDGWVAQGRARVVSRTGASAIYAFDVPPVAGWPLF